MQEHWKEILFLLTFGLYSAAILNVYLILGARRPPASTISWIWAHISIPFFAVPLYWLIGRVRIRNTSLLSDEENLPHTEHHKHILESTVAIDKLVSLEHLNLFAKVFKTFGPLFSPKPNHAKLLIDGEQTFEAIFTAISSANKYILVQYYLLRSDALGIELQKLLIDKAKDGVRVYLLFDNIGSLLLSRKYLTELKRAGVHVFRFLPGSGIKRLFLINFRNHRKLVSVDGYVALTGGLNVGEDYYTRKFTKHGYWRDTHLQVVGPSVAHFEEIFCQDWMIASGENIRSILSNLRAEMSDIPPWNREPKDATSYVQVIPSSPNDRTLVGSILFMQLIQAAQRRLWITTPFFVPDESLQLELELAVLRGVDVRILIPKSAEKRVVHWVTLSYAEQMQRRGVKIYLYEKGFIHQKVVLVDDSLSVIGTSNFDNRAIYLNYELMVLVHDLEFSQKTLKMLENDFLNAKEFHPRRDRFIRRLIHLRANSARLLAPLL